MQKPILGDFCKRVGYPVFPSLFEKANRLAFG